MIAPPKKAKKAKKLKLKPLGKTKLLISVAVNLFFSARKAGEELLFLRSILWLTSRSVGD